ncbi:hypothetical protein G9C98_000475 [Cotesia typhae]|uniref:Uncharacterized protein n=1 Tax=Cotesia typhae TaxID=2053667 RepID=A0A8J5QUV3_9HYME|nr:hypothetical protein G9C98_000475 [Cotesia typhae]
MTDEENTDRINTADVNKDHQIADGVNEDDENAGKTSTANVTKDLHNAGGVNQDEVNAGQKNLKQQKPPESSVLKTNSLARKISLAGLYNPSDDGFTGSSACNVPGLTVVYALIVAVYFMLL